MRANFNRFCLVLVIALLIAITFVLLSPAWKPVYAQSNTIYLPMVTNYYKTPPLYTESIYISTSDKPTVRSLGRQFGSSAASGLVILDFGNPRMLFSGTTPGTKLVSQSINLTTSQISDLTKEFIIGYWDGYHNAGGYTINPNAFVTVGTGLNNCGIGGTPLPPHVCVPGGGNMPSIHGRTWAIMVRGIADWITNQGYQGRVAAAAAIDAEPTWNYSLDTRAWLNGYNGYFSCGQPMCPSDIRIYDFGTCDDCKYARSDGTLCTPSDTACLTMPYSVTTTTGVLNWSWHLDDVRYIAWTATYSRPVPEIYVSPKNDREWYGLSRYHADLSNLPIEFKGVMTTTIGNLPNDGWSKLWARLAVDDKTRINDIPWSTRIRFQ
jgi:hypothetical protein